MFTVKVTRFSAVTLLFALAFLFPAGSATAQTSGPREIQIIVPGTKPAGPATVVPPAPAALPSGPSAAPQRFTSQVAAVATAQEMAQIAALVAEIEQQQATIQSQQSQIEQRLAAVAEELRTARIYIGRGGGKAR
jgi:hypothetical protein